MKKQQNFLFVKNTKFSAFLLLRGGFLLFFYLFSWSCFSLFVSHLHCFAFLVFGMKHSGEKQQQQQKRVEKKNCFLHLSGNKCNIISVCFFFLLNREKHKKKLLFLSQPNFPTNFLLKKQFFFFLLLSVNVNIFLLCVICVRVTHTANYSRIIDSTEFPRKI